MSFYGMMYVASVTPKVTPGNVVFNSRSVTDMLNFVPKHARVAVFPQLTLTSGSCGELFCSPELHKSVINGIFDIAESTKDRNTVIIVGAPIENSGKLYSCAVALYEGRILAIIPKTYIDGSRNSDEGRYFTSGELCREQYIRLRGELIPFGSDIILNCNNYNNFKIACELGSDINAPKSPAIDYALAGATVICGLGSSYKSIAMSDAKCRELQGLTSKLKCAYIYSALGFGEDGNAFVNDGKKIVFECGEVLNTASGSSSNVVTMIDIQRITGERSRCSEYYSSLPAKKYREIDFDINLENYDMARYTDKKPFLLGIDAQAVIDTQAHLLFNRMEKLKTDKMLIQLKGDPNSILAFLVCERVCQLYSKPYNNILAITTFDPVDDIRLYKCCFDIAQRLDVNLLNYPAKKNGVKISEIDETGNGIIQLHGVYPEFLSEEVNKLAIKNKAVIVGTSDLTDIALCTHDFCCNSKYMYNINSTLPKTVVKAIIEQYIDICDEKELAETLTQVVAHFNEEYKSVTSVNDGIESFALVDYIMYYYLKHGFSRDKIHDMIIRTFYDCYSHKDIDKVLSLFFTRFFDHQYMRSTVADGAKILEIDLSASGHRYIQA